MKGLFQRTGAPIQTAMLIEMIRLMQECQQVVDIPDAGDMPVKPEKPLEASRLEDLGFTSAAPVERHRRQVELYKERLHEFNRRAGRIDDVHAVRKARMDTIRVLLQARKDFGEDTLLIPFTEFEALMRRYNLVCGPFSSYRGEIPSDKLGEIAVLKLKVASRSYKYIPRLYPITGLRYDPDKSMFRFVPGYIKRFPFARNKKDHSYWSGPLYDMHGNKTSGNSYDWEYKTGSPVELFICAPSKDMAKVRSLKAPHLSYYKDPFICAHTDYGILVFTRWGEEADDRVIRRCEAANAWLDKARAFIESQQSGMLGFTD